MSQADVMAIAELTRSNAELKLVARVAAHDLKEPLRTIAGCLQLLQRRHHHELSPNATAILDEAIAASSRMQALITRLLDRAEGSPRREPADDCDADEVCRAALANLRQAVESSGAIVTIDRLPRLAVNPLDLLEVLQNLIANAIQHRAIEAPRIWIEAAVFGRECVLSLRDNGPGIPAGHLEHLYRTGLAAEDLAAGEGGLGLATCGRILQRYGGRLWAESRPNSGTTVSFTAPLAGEPIAPATRHLDTPVLGAS